MVEELSKLYPNADVKKVDDGNYLDIHMPDIHPKRGTHIWFNTPKSGGIKVGFFCRDNPFVDEALKKNEISIEKYSNGLRVLGHPTFKKVEDAIKVADSFIKQLKMWIMETMYVLGLDIDDDKFIIKKDSRGVMLVSKRRWTNGQKRKRRKT